MISLRFALGVLCVLQVIILGPQTIEAFGARQLSLGSLAVSPRAASDDFPTCDIYCRGRLLHTVQMSEIFKDSKTFVDMKLKNLPNVTLKLFDDWMLTQNNAPNKSEVEKFVTENFEDRGKEFVDWSPSDWKENPRFLDVIKNPQLKKWGKDLNDIWKVLGRKMIDDVHKNPDYYSIIPVDNPVIVPGGRFIEFYYWDSYWVIRGLLYSEMHQTARGMLSNFLSIIQRYGSIPNGGRVYYSKRTQPPFLAGMIKSYVEFTKDEQFAIDAVDTLAAEFEFFMNTHMVDVNGYSLGVYRERSTGPRPESYREDYKNAQIFPTDVLKQAYYSEIAAGAESGMDFSSRWFIDANGTKNGNLTTIKCRSIVAVDLNAVLYWNAKIIAEFYLLTNNVAKTTEYETKAAKLLEGIQAVLWNEKAGVWLDYDLINKKPREYFVPTNLAPLWMKAYNRADREKISKSVVKYLVDLKIDQFPGGTPNTLENTGEQWDFPNAWPPMQYMIIEGLDSLKTPEAMNMSRHLGYRWVQSNYQAFKDHNAMLEKYDCETFGGIGGGGEYDLQKGFGWSNGVIIELLTKYGDKITPHGGSSSKAALSITVIASFAVLTSIFGRLM